MTYSHILNYFLSLDIHFHTDASCKIAFVGYFTEDSFFAAPVTSVQRTEQKKKIEILQNNVRMFFL